VADRRLPYSVKDDRGALRQGEVLIARAWRADLEINPDAEFTVVLLQQQPAEPIALSAPNVIVCAPAAPVRLPAAVHEAALAYAAGAPPAPIHLPPAAVESFAAGRLIAAHPLAPLTPSLGHRSLLRLHHDPDPRRQLDAIEMLNPSVAGRARRPHRAALNELMGLAAVGNSDAHVLEHVGTGWTWFAGASADDYRAAVAERSTEAQGEYWTHWHNVSVYGRQLVAKARHVRHTLRPTGEWR